MPRADDRPDRHGTARRLRRLRDLLGLTQREMAREFKVARGARRLGERKRPPPGPVLKLLELYEEETGLPALMDYHHGSRRRRRTGSPPERWTAKKPRA